MPTAEGPPFLRAALNFSAITVKASSQDTGVNSPVLSNLPFFLAQQRAASADPRRT